MRDQEIIGLYEAYQQVCESSEIISERDEMEKNPLLHLTYDQRAKRLKDKAEQIRRKKGKTRTEEVEYITEESYIAAEYFYNLGLNEHGVDILIDELGLNEFVEFVEDITESYYLTEEEAAAPKPRRTRKPKAETTDSDPTPARKPRTRKPKAETTGETPKPRKTTPRKTTARKKAVETAQQEQPKSSTPPKKRPMLDAIARQVTKGIERHKKATKGLGKAASETGKLIGNLAKGAAAVTGGVASGTLGAAGMAGHLAAKGLKKEDFELWVNSLVEEGYDLSEYTWDDMCEIYMEEVGTDLFDHILEHLVAEGFADTNEAALVIMANMSKEWRQSIVNEGLFGGRGSFDAKAARERLNNLPGPRTGGGIGGPGAGIPGSQGPEIKLPSTPSMFFLDAKKKSSSITKTA